MDHQDEDGRLSQELAVRQRSIRARYNALDPENRGVIVVDTCALFALAGEALQGKYFFDALTFMSEHGYKIVIPDMVAYEAAQVLPNGKYLGDYFTNNGRRGYSKRDYPQLVSFIKDIADGKHPNIRIARSEKPEHVAGFIGRLVEITDLDTPSRESRHAIMDEQDKHSDRKNWGDEAISELVKTLPHSPPVHVLTEDYMFLNAIVHLLPELNVVTPAGLLFALAESGLSRAIPFMDPSANANALIASCQQSLAEQKRDSKTSLAVYDVSMKVVSARPPVPHDCPMQMGCTHMAQGLGYGRPDASNSIVAAEIPMEDENDTRRIQQLRQEQIKARRDKKLKGGTGDDRGGKGWLRLS